MLERPGELVTREALRERLWSDDTFVDFDRSLNMAVVKIREALGDSAVEAGSPEGLIEIDLSEQPLSRLIDEARTLSLFASARVIVGTSAPTLFRLLQI